MVRVVRNRCTATARQRDPLTSAFDRFDCLLRVGYGPSLRGDERLLRRDSGRYDAAHELALTGQKRTADQSKSTHCCRADSRGRSYDFIAPGTTLQANLNQI